MPTTVATGIRMPRMHGTPPILSGSVMIRVNITGRGYDGWPSMCPAFPGRNEVLDGHGGLTEWQEAQGLVVIGNDPAKCTSSIVACR